MADLVISNNVLQVPEGGMEKICVNITNEERERNIVPLFTIEVGSRFTGIIVILLLLQHLFNEQNYFFSGR